MITISHTHADGTLVDGTSRGDGTAEILKAARFRWFPSLRTWGVPQSRDKVAKTWQINQAKTALEAAGFDVTVTIDETVSRSFAEAEAERYERAEGRAEYHQERAKVADSRADAHWNAEQAILDVIPAGQPILVGHHSEKRHRGALAKADSHMRHGFAELGKRDYHETRAATAATHQQSRENVRTTLRRIEKLEADERRVTRKIAGDMKWALGDDGEHHLTLVKPAGAHLERLTVILADLREQIAYWRNHVAAVQQSGVKIWSRDDFTKGDYVQFLGTWYEVLRVSAKSVSIPAMINDGPIVTMAGARCTWTDIVQYHKVTGRKSAADMAALFAEVDRRTAAAAV